MTYTPTLTELFPEKSQQTPLGVAAFKAHIEVVQCLLERGAAIDPQGEKGNLPLPAGSHPVALDDFGWTPLYMPTNERPGLSNPLTIDRADYQTLPTCLVSNTGREGAQALYRHSLSVLPTSWNCPGAYS